MVIEIADLGLFEVDDALVEYLKEFDDVLVDTVKRGDVMAARGALSEMVDHIISHGTELGDDVSAAASLPHPGADFSELVDLLADAPDGLLPNVF